MAFEATAALIGCVVGLIIGAVLTRAIMRRKTIAEIATLNAQAEELRADAERIRIEFNRLASAQADRVRLLFVAADPEPSLRLGEEIRGIVEGVRTSGHEDAFEVWQLWGTRWHDLRTELLRNTPYILHFAGHASPAGLHFEGGNGRADIIPNEQFSRFLLPFSGRIRLVFVNACDSSQLCEALSKSIDFVIGMTGEIPDENAIDFATVFYQVIADRQPVATAFNFAMASLDTTGDDKVYTLFARTQALAGTASS